MKYEVKYQDMGQGLVRRYDTREAAQEFIDVNRMVGGRSFRYEGPYVVFMTEQDAREAVLRVYKQLDEFYQDSDAENLIITSRDTGADAAYSFTMPGTFGTDYGYVSPVRLGTEQGPNARAEIVVTFTGDEGHSCYVMSDGNVLI